MAVVKFTYALKRFYPDLKETHVEGKTVAEVIEQLETIFPGLPAYLVDERGRLRKHVNIFLDGSLIKDRKQLSDVIAPGKEVFIMQALSGG